MINDSLNVHWSPCVFKNAITNFLIRVFFSIHWGKLLSPESSLFEHDAFARKLFSIIIPKCREQLSPLSLCSRFNVESIRSQWKVLLSRLHGMLTWRAKKKKIIFRVYYTRYLYFAYLWKKAPRGRIFRFVYNWLDDKRPLKRSSVPFAFLMIL